MHQPKYENARIPKEKKKDEKKWERKRKGRQGLAQITSLLPHELECPSFVEINYNFPSDKKRDCK